MFVIVSLPFSRSNPGQNNDEFLQEEVAAYNQIGIPRLPHSLVFAAKPFNNM